MRKGWTYKPWSEVLTIINGKNQKAVESKNGEFPIYGSGGIMGYASEWLCPEDCVIVGRKGNINKPIFVTSKFWNVDTAFGLNANKNRLRPRFLFYFCKNYNFELLNKAVTIPSLTKVDLLKILMPVPGLIDQDSIVSELDKINELIALKKSQLRDIDALSQSIFYEMFGDPITNEKGWEVKKVIDVVKLQRGFDLPVQNRLTYGNIPIYGSNGIVGFHTVSKASYGIITGRSGSIGEVFMSDKPFWPLNTSLFSVDCHGNNILYLKFLIQSYHLERFKQGAGVPTLNRNSFHSNDIIDVPVSLQQSFANKIEAIEEQKFRINQSLKDLETLLQSRMDYWFND